MTNTPNDVEDFTVALTGGEEPKKETPWMLILIAIALGIALMMSG